MRVLLLALVPCAVGLLGCAVTEPERSTSFMKQDVAETLGDQVAQIVVAIIEQPIGELFINKELWEHTDPQVVGLEHQPVLDENGFRVGQLIGSPPQRLQELLQSERTCTARRRVVQSGFAFTQPVSKPRPYCEFTVNENGTRLPQRFNDVEFHLEMQPTLAAGNATRIRFTPRVQHGQAAPIYKSTDKGWTMEIKKPAQLFPQSAWEVVLQPSDTLIIGGLLDRQDSLGFQAFVEQDLSPMQRLLVIRAGSGKGEAGQLATAEANEVSPPLAMQATMRASQR